MMSIEKATEKLKQEECNKQQAILRDMLINALKDDEQLADAVLNPLKSIRTCFIHLHAWAKPMAVCNCAVVSDDEVLGEAIHYFLDVEEKPAEPPKSIIVKKEPAPKKEQAPKELKKMIDKSPQINNNKKICEPAQQVNLFEEISLF